MYGVMPLDITSCHHALTRLERNCKSTCEAEVVKYGEHRRLLPPAPAVLLIAFARWHESRRKEASA